MGVPFEALIPYAIMLGVSLPTLNSKLQPPWDPVLIDTDVRHYWSGTVKD
jgi:hypothetical protein